MTGRASHSARMCRLAARRSHSPSTPSKSTHISPSLKNNCKMQNAKLKRELLHSAFYILHSLEVAMTTVAAPPERTADVPHVPSPQEITQPALEGQKETMVLNMG